MKFSLKFILIIVSSTLFLSSCGAAPSKGNMVERIGRDIQIGATKTDLLKYIDTLEINGIKAGSTGYIKSKSPQTINVNGKSVDVEGVIDIEFRGRGLVYCGAFAIFYFDKTDRLITYVTDDIFCDMV